MRVESARACVSGTPLPAYAYGVDLPTYLSRLILPPLPRPCLEGFWNKDKEKEEEIRAAEEGGGSPPRSRTNTIRPLLERVPLGTSRCG